MTTLTISCAPVSMSRAASNMTMASGDFLSISFLCRSTSSNIRGCRMEFNTALFAGSLNIIRPRSGLLMRRSSSKIPCPNCPTISCHAGSPGMISSWAIASASIIQAPRDLNIPETMLFPLAIPPVRPTTSMGNLYHIPKRKKRKSLCQIGCVAGLTNASQAVDTVSHLE